jgi:hypothetical protein
MIMHGLLVSVIELLRSRGLSVIEAESYAQVLEEPLLNLEGDNAEGETARGPDFWLAGVRGAAGSVQQQRRAPRAALAPQHDAARHRDRVAISVSFGRPADRRAI